PTDIIPAFCLGADFEFYKYFMEDIGMKTEHYNQYLKDGIVDTPPVNHALSVAMNFDCDWYTWMPRLHFDSKKESMIDTWGSFQKILVRDNGIPHAWYSGPSLTSKKEIKAWWEKGRPKGYINLLLKGVKKTLRTLMKPKYNEFLMLVGLSGPYECISMSIGLGQLAKYCRKEPEFVREILERNFEVQGKGLEKLCKINPPIVMCGDDYGYVNGLQMPVKYWRQFIKPILKQYVEIVHNHDLKFILHSCGNIGAIFKDFVELNIDGVESLQPTINDLGYLKRKYGDKLALLGTIDDTDLLVNAEPADVKKKVTHQIKILGKNGGYIPGATNFLLNQKVENIIAMIDTIHTFNF
ncbi:MAG: hypothetical protein GF364_03205, partial [Candidatus Lokiarchaeota archaeon]|nr:hypothetical protein [Candidatus Lokiarchaeota archaeon]